MENAIIKYVRDDCNEKIGVIVAVKLDGNIFNIDYSYCSKYDDFNKKFGRSVAYNRATQNRKNRVRMKIVHPIMLEAYADMIYRAERYFKDCEPSEKVKWIEQYYSLDEPIEEKVTY